MNSAFGISLAAALASAVSGALALLLGAPEALAIGLAAAGAAAGGFVAARIGEPAAAPIAPPGETPALPAPDAHALVRLPAAVAVIDRGARVRLANDAAAAAFGAPGPDTRLATWIRAPDLLEAVEEALAGAGDRDLVFTYLRAKEERPILAQIRALDLRDPGAAVMVQFEDQTRARHIEALRETFIANASHELKTPLASIIGFIETLQGPARDDPKARDRFLSIMSSQAERMRRLVEDLMSLNRIELNVNNRPSQIVDLGAIVHETAAAFEPVAEAAGATLLIEAPERGPMIRGDRDQLAQLLTNLIDNAIKYGGKPPTIRVSPAPPAPEWPGMIGLTINDNGQGIDREHIPRLTERFYRVDAARSRAVGGTGLGLAIAKHILQRHRGELSVRSTPGEGAAFTVWLPSDR